jgi:hypothetical protein
MNVNTSIQTPMMTRPSSYLAEQNRIEQRQRNGVNPLVAIKNRIFKPKSDMASLVSSFTEKVENRQGLSINDPTLVNWEKELNSVEPSLLDRLLVKVGLKKEESPLARFERLAQKAESQPLRQVNGQPASFTQLPTKPGTWQTYKGKSQLERSLNLPSAEKP